MRKKHPHSEFESAGREIVCFFVGHKWKYPKQRYTELTNEEYKAADAKTSHMHYPPNPYWHKVTSWTAKCRRCRRFSKVRFPGSVWYKELWRAVYASILEFRWWFMVTWKNEYKDVRYPKLLALPLAILASISQFFAHAIDHENFPFFLVEWFTHWQYQLYERFYIDETDDPKSNGGVSGDGSH